MGIACGYMYMIFGWNYLFTFIATAGLYTKFTSWVNKKRIPELRLAK
jgi:ABC-type transport system involved in Fe-S cluster assembly fused permease/ATPase subunit